MSAYVIGRNSEPFPPQPISFVVTARFEKTIHQELVGRSIFPTELNRAAGFGDGALRISTLCRNGQLQVDSRIGRIQLDRPLGFLDGLLVMALLAQAQRVKASRGCVR